MGKDKTMWGGDEDPFFWPHPAPLPSLISNPKISLTVHKSSIMQPIDTAPATKIKYLFPYLVAISLFGQNPNQRITPTLTNKSHPFRHTQIRRLIFQIKLQNPSPLICMHPNPFQSEDSTICTKTIWEILTFDRGRDRSERKLEGHFFFPVWIYFLMINYQLF